MASTESLKVKNFIYTYFQLAQSKEIQNIEEFLDPRFTKFGDAPPYDRRDFERALMLEQLPFASLSDYDFKIENLNTEVMGDVALATLWLDMSFSFSSKNMPYAFLASAFLWTIACTAFIIATGQSDCQMFLPMSTPAAPCVIASYASFSASGSGSFLPPAIISGTGHPSTTSSKLSQ